MAIRACVVVMLLGLLGRSFACEDVTVVYRDGRYLVLEINILEVVDVGNLWWLGISSIPVLYPGLSSARFAFSTNRLGRVLGEPDVGSLPQEALVVLENLAERTSTFDYEIYRSRHARWVAGTDRLAVWQQKRSKFSILDAGLGELDSWTLPEHDVGELFACPTEGGLVVAGYRQRTVYKGPDVIVDTLAFPEGTKDCALSGPFLDCMGGFECRRDSRFVSGVLHVSKNEVAFAFEHEGRFTIPKDPKHRRPFLRFENRLLFADGRRLLQQEELGTPDTPGWNSYRVQPTDRLRVLDTASGRVVSENKTAPVGTASRLFCPGGKERFVVTGDGKVHLIDLGTLDTIATATIPLGRPFVF